MHPQYRPICLMYSTIMKERFCIRQGNNLTFEVFPLKSHLGKSFACLLSDGNSLMLYPIRNRCVLIGLDHLQIVVPDNRSQNFPNEEEILDNLMIIFSDYHFIHLILSTLSNPEKCLWRRILS